MPGGALFSAPLVDSCDPEEHVAGGMKARANHWFRHVWEYWWPLYPGVLLAMEILEFEVWQMMLLGVPLTLSAVGAGYLFLLRPVRHAHEVPVEQTENPPALLPHLTPIIVVVIGYGVVRLGYAVLGGVGVDLPPMNRYLPMAIGLVCAMSLLQAQRPISARDWGKIIFSLRTLNIAVIVAAVRVYGAFIEADLPGGTPLVAQMRAELSEWGIPLLAVIMILPLVSGLATGLSIGFVGASFPIVLRLLGADPGFGELLATGVLAYGFGYMGMLLSPVHVCLVVTCEHFKVGVGRAMAGMAPPAAVILVCSVVLYGIWSWVLV
jgi:hypothetical protein